MPGSERDESITVYDFRRPESFDRQQLRVLAGPAETLARAMGQELASALRARVHVQAAPLTQMAASALGDHLPTPAACQQFTMTALPGRGLLHFPVSFAYAILDLCLGGDARGPFPDRPLTEIERGLLAELIAPVLRCLQDALGVSGDMTVHPPGPAGDIPEMGAPGEGFVLAELSVEIHGLSFSHTVEGVMTVAMPMTMLRPVVEQRMAERDEAKSAELAVVATERLMVTRLDVSLRFPGVRVSSRDLLALERGDILRLELPHDQPLHLCVGDRPMLPATPVRSGRRMAAAVEAGPSSSGAPR